MTELEVLDRIASGENIYGFVCSHGSDTIKAARKALEAIKKQKALETLLQQWGSVEIWDTNRNKGNLA